MKVDEILEMWDSDCVINDTHLGEAATSTPKLHSKYIKLLIDAKLRLTKLRSDYNTLRKAKFRYYRGELTREELQQYGWEQWQYNKPLKTEMDEFLKGDSDLQVIQTRIEYMETMVYTLESILTQIKARDFQIKNGITWKQFLAGM